MHSPPHNNRGAADGIKRLVHCESYLPQLNTTLRLAILGSE